MQRFLLPNLPHLAVVWLSWNRQRTSFPLPQRYGLVVVAAGAVITIIIISSVIIIVTSNSTSRAADTQGAQSTESPTNTFGDMRAISTGAYNKCQTPW